VDVVLKFRYRAVDAAAQRALGEQGEPALDLVDP
jgi:hypothetical protein